MDRSFHGLNLPPGPKENLGFLISLSKCGTQRKEERMRLKSYPQSDTKKMEPGSSFQIQRDKKCYKGGLQGGFT